MSDDALAQQIAQLVDVLRSNESDHLSLVDVASVTEILVATAQSYFAGLDTSIYKECRALSDGIADARREIPAAAGIAKLVIESSEKIESAANEILTLLGETKGANPEIEERARDIVASCAVQSDAGASIGAILQALQILEDRVNEMQDGFGAAEPVPGAEEAEREPAGDDADGLEVLVGDAETSADAIDEDSDSNDFIRGRTTTQEDIDTLFA